MNEALFFTHILIVLGFILLAYRMGSAALTALIVLLGVLANVFVVKQMTLFHWTVTCSDVFAIGSILGMNLLQESWGKEAVSKAIRVSLVCLLFFALMAQVHLLYTPSPADRTQEAFSTILSASPRIILASIAVYYLVQQIDMRFFGLLQKMCAQKFLPLRLLLSLLVSQGIDTVLFSFLGLYGLVESILDVIVMSYLVKCVIIASSSTFVAAARRLVGPS
ncbi:MAG: queuosine precursor transporter [Chlamydiales bacterium]|nr:queuosine precursor transporter [Chlamydiales bacterium]